MARPTLLAMGKGIEHARRRSQPDRLRVHREALRQALSGRGRGRTPLRAQGSRRANRHTSRASEWLGVRARWSTFAAHPWSLINDHRGRARRFGDSFPRPFTAPRAPRCSRAARHRACAVCSVCKSEAFADSNNMARRRARRGRARSPGGWMPTRPCSRFSAHAQRRATCDESQGVPAVRHDGHGGRLLRLQGRERHPQGASRGPAASGWTARRDRPVDVGARGSRPIPARGATG